MADHQHAAHQVVREAIQGALDRRPARIFLALRVVGRLELVGEGHSVGLPHGALRGVLHHHVDGDPQAILGDLIDVHQADGIGD